MQFAFEGQEICNSQGLTGNQRSTRVQIAQQYKVAATIATCISQIAANEAAKENIDDTKIAKLESYHTILTNIHQTDLAPKIQIATDYTEKSNASKRCQSHFSRVIKAQTWFLLYSFICFITVLPFNFLVLLDILYQFQFSHIFLCHF
jgi:uncharacterized membrane protein